MRYFINYRYDGLTKTDNPAEAERLLSIGFTEISKKLYDIEYARLWNLVAGI